MDSVSPAITSVAGQPTTTFGSIFTFGTFTLNNAGSTDRSGNDTTRQRLGYRGSSGYYRLPDGEGAPA